MNNSDSKDKNKDFLENSQGLDSADYVNLKIALRPIKFYKLHHCDRSKIHEYSYVIDKIKSSASNTNYSIIIFLNSNSRDPRDSREEVKISSENEWKIYFEESGQTIFDLVDSKNTLKIEYIYTKNSSFNPDNSIVNNEVCLQEEKLKNIFHDKDKFGLELLKSVFSLTLKNESIKNKLREDLLINSLKNENVENAINSRYFDYFLKKQFERVLEKIQNLSLLKISIGEEGLDSESEIIIDENEDEGVIDIPPFSEYYKNEHIELFRSKILSQTFLESKK